MRFEFENKMVDDFLMNEDRMSMAHGLETRVPFLDRRVVEFAAGLPDRLRIRFVNRKWLLRTLMADSLPKRILTRRKHGFTFDPVAQFQSGLGAYLKKYLTRERVRKTNLFEWTFIRKILEADPHPNLRHHYFLLWQICGFTIWHELFVEDSNPWTETF
jgi:asparagine synthase (glutamine-hydrolysing)